MVDSCPFQTNLPGNVKIPPVPVATATDVPNVPSSSGDIESKSNDHNILDMGGTTSPNESTRQSCGWLANQIFQVRPPHLQNALEPCTITGRPEQLDNTNISLLADPNSGKRQCFNVYDAGQVMVGSICTTPGTDGVLDSRERYDGEGVNGNADWVRGNRFGVRYNPKMIDNRIKYTYKTPALLATNKEYITYDPFYPTPDHCLEGNCWNKQYPHTKLYTDGYPTWRYPYHTTQPGSRSPTYRLSQLESLEGFTDYKSRTNVCFWIGSLVILSSVVYLCRKR